MVAAVKLLITGGSGSFGRAFARRMIARYDVSKVVILSRGEHAQADMAAGIDDPQSKLRFFIGDVRDRDRLKRAMQGIDTVIHAAALKRIEVGQYNPLEVKKTNIDGAVNVIEAATDAGVRNVVALSTDKAFQPVSPYGTSKAFAESLFLAANNTRGTFGPVFAVCRYGNVWGSNGSVVPKWMEILRNSDTVPVTDPDCTRFYMTMNEAMDLVEDTIGQKGMFIPELPAYRLGDLAEAMGAKMHITGLPAWEKRHESMDHDKSSDRARRMSVSELRSILGYEVAQAA